MAVNKILIGLIVLTLTILSPLGMPLALADKATKLSKTKLDRTPAKKLFGRIKTGAKLPPKSIGFYTKGCLSGAVQVPMNGSAWQVMRPNRNRNWGHPKLVELVKRLAIEAKVSDGWNGLLVGDLSQPRGGPMLTGHASHQLGLDADIWLTQMPDRILTRKERTNISATLMVLDRKRIHPKRWTESHNRLLRRAASYREVQRIFVHPPIKKALCDWSKGQKNRGWLRKIRAYYGHNYHFHIRMRCPAGIKGCRSQNEPRPKDGTGCTTELAYWMSAKPWRPAKPSKKPKKPRKPRRLKTLKDLPAQCRTVLLAQ